MNTSAVSAVRWQLGSGKVDLSRRGEFIQQGKAQVGGCRKAEMTTTDALWTFFALETFANIAGPFRTQTRPMLQIQRMKLRTTLFASLLGVSALPAVAQMPSAENWQIGPWVRGRNYSEGMPEQPRPAPGGGVTFDFPIAGRGQIDAMTTHVAALAGARQITLRYRIEADPRTQFLADETPGEAPTVSLYFQRRGDNWSGAGRYASYRWYVPAPAVIPLASGERTVTVRFDEVWTNVNGQPNTQDPSGYAVALANASDIGIAFGSSSRRSHGVYATGPARFILLSLDIS